MNLKKNKVYTWDEIFAYLEKINKIFLIYDFNTVIDKSVEFLHDIINFNDYAFFSIHSENNEYFIKKTSIKNIKEKDFIKEKEILNWVLNENKIASIPLDEDNLELGECLCLPLVLGLFKAGILQLKIKDEWSLVNNSVLLLLNIIKSNLCLALENRRLYSDMELHAVESEKNKIFINNILESIPNGIITLNEEGIITHFNRNACAMMNILGTDILGKKYTECFPNNIKLEFTNIIEETKKQGFVIDKMMEIKYDENEIFIGINSSLFYGNSSELLGLIIIIRDMTASKELERLRKIDQMKTEFVSNVSHELRTPLTSIRAYVDSLLNIVPETDIEQRREFLNIIKEESNLLLELIEDILNLSKIESGKTVLDFKIVFLKDIINQALQSITYNENIFKLIVDIKDDIEIIADQDKARQVFINLINNAVKYSPFGGEIKINANVENNKVYIKIQDQGIGMTEEQVSRIFEKFYRADTSHNISGTGLGMSLVKEILNKHEVKIIISSEINKGTVINLIWPKE